MAKKINTTNTTVAPTEESVTKEFLVPVEVSIQTTYYVPITGKNHFDACENLENKLNSRYDEFSDEDVMKSVCDEIVNASTHETQTNHNYFIKRPDTIRERR